MNEVLAHLLDAVRHAPSLMNTQPWRVSTPPPHPLSASGRGDRQIIDSAEARAHRAHLAESHRGGVHDPSAQAMLLRPPPSPFRRGGAGGG